MKRLFIRISYAAFKLAQTSCELEINFYQTETLAGYLTV